MFKSFFKSKKWAAWAWGGLAALLTSVYTQVEITVYINEWYKGFYNLMQEGGDVSLFWEQIIAFCWLAFPYIGVAAITNWFTRVYALRWREAMTFSYIPRWLETEKEIEGSSQRIQEDCFKWADTIQNLGLQLVRAILTLMAFIPVLWHLSKDIEIPYLSNLPGCLVWLALIVSGGGMFISWFVGYFLPKLEYNNQVTEAAFRKELVLGEDDKVNYCSAKELVSLFTGIRLNHQRLYMHYGYFDIWVYLFDQFMSIAPYLIAGPMVVTKVISLGALIQISNAFSKVQGSMSLFIHNWTTITSARSVFKRLREFEDNMNKGDNT